MTTPRLIEQWLPMAALGEESIRERRSMTALPPTYYLHVWWARRPLVASRAAILGSLLPADADHELFMRMLGILGDPVRTRERIDAARRSGADLGPDPYGYPRAFQHSPSSDDLDTLAFQMARIGITDPVVLDPTAGGGSIPMESLRLRLPTQANDLNPVAVLIQRCTFEFPLKFGAAVQERFVALAERFVVAAEPHFEGVYLREGGDTTVLGYLWARTITCPYCDGLIPLSPNWRLAPDGTGVRLRPDPATKRCTFSIVVSVDEQSAGTVAGGDATCPYTGCGRAVEGEEVKRQAQAGQMGEQLFAIAYKRREMTRSKAGKPKEKWVRGYRTPRPEDDVSERVCARLAEKLPEWEAMDLIPIEQIPDGNKTTEPRRYGMTAWRDLFSPRQLLAHATSVEIYRELLQEYEACGELDEVTRAAFSYLALSLDKLRDYNSRMARWHVNREVIVNTFDRHDFSFKWSYAEMAPLIAGFGYDWAIEQTAKCIKELVALSRPDAQETAGAGQGGFDFTAFTPPPVHITCKSADALDHLANASVDCVVMDPPYYDNVMYAELSDFFYVWLKRTAGYVYPELFRRQLTDKDLEAVANPAKFRGERGAKALAGRNYQDRMAAIFAECRRVLKPDGIMTLMFTHKATGAWDALTKGLMEAGFTITASWPVNTEAEGSLHIKDKSAANSTIFLVCRPRAATTDGENVYWEDVEPRVAAAVRRRIGEFQAAGITGVDLYLASFGPALEEFSLHWPLKRGTPRPQPEVQRRRRQSELFEEEWDPYLATPEDALDAARREVKRWRLEQLTHMKARVELDPVTAWFVLAWDAFRAPQFAYDEALRLARAVGVDLEREIVGRLAEKKGDELILWDSARRAAKAALRGADGSQGMIDALHHAAHVGRTRTLESAVDVLKGNELSHDARFLASLEAVLEVLPISAKFSGIDLEGIVAGAGSDFEALEMLRRLAFADRVDEPRQLALLPREE